MILDEPTTGLDIQSRDALWAAVDRLRDAGVHGRAHHPLPGGGAAARRPHRAHARGQAAPGRHGRASSPRPCRRSSASRCRPALRSRRPSGALNGASTSRPSTCRTTSTASWTGPTTHGVELQGLRSRPDPPRRRLPRPRRRLNPRARLNHEPPRTRRAKEPPPCSTSLAVSSIQIFRNRLVLVTGLSYRSPSAASSSTSTNVLRPGQPRLHRGDRDVHRAGLRALHHRGDHPGVTPAEPVPQAPAFHRGGRRQHPHRTGASRPPSSRSSRWSRSWSCSAW